MVASVAALNTCPMAVDVHPAGTAIPMPVIRPIPLRTRGRSWWQRTKAWLWDAREWELQEDYIYTRTNGEQLLIPAGFRTDFASSPRAGGRPAHRISMKGTGPGPHQLGDAWCVPTGARPGTCPGRGRSGP